MYIPIEIYHNLDMGELVQNIMLLGVDDLIYV